MAPSVGTGHGHNWHGPHLGAAGDVASIESTFGIRPVSLRVGEHGIMYDLAGLGFPGYLTPLKRLSGKALEAWMVDYNTVHAYYRGRQEHIFSIYSNYALVRNRWRTPGEAGLEHLRVVMKGFMEAQNFLRQRTLRYSVFLEEVFQGMWKPRTTAEKTSGGRS